MKQIHICVQGLWGSFIEKDPVYKILKKNYEVVLHDNPYEADYLICSLLDTPYEYCKFDKIRILYSGENYIPDFNLIDYGISSYPLKLGDRHMHMPRCICNHFLQLAEMDRSKAREVLANKKYFANFIAGHESEFSIRGDFFKKIEREYKRVESPGTYLNNMPNGETVQWTNESKRQFQSQCKFTLCFESTKHEGFITEKITDAFWSNTIPVYYGSSDIKQIFNPKAFIDCSDFSSFDEVIEKIKELDQDDEKYIAMLSEPILQDSHFLENKMIELEKFLCNIFDQPIESAYRRSRVYIPKNIESYILHRKDNYAIIRTMPLKELIRAYFSRVKYKLKRK